MQLNALSNAPEVRSLHLLLQGSHLSERVSDPMKSSFTAPLTDSFSESPLVVKGNKQPERRSCCFVFSLTLFFLMMFHYRSRLQLPRSRVALSACKPAACRTESLLISLKKNKKHLIGCLSKHLQEACASPSRWYAKFLILTFCTSI